MCADSVVVAHARQRPYEDRFHIFSDKVRDLLNCHVLFYPPETVDLKAFIKNSNIDPANADLPHEKPPRPAHD